MEATLIEETIDVEADVRIDEMLRDAVPPPACEWRLKGRRGDPAAEYCGEPATWLLVIRCGHSAYLCGAHQEKQDALLGSSLRVRCARDGFTTYFDWIKL